MRIVQCLCGLIASTLVFFPPAAAAQIQLSPVVSGLSNPVFVGNARDGLNRLFIVERAGIIKVVQPGSSTATPFLDIRNKIVSTGGEQGLLGLAFHPEYRDNGRFFVFYTRIGDGTLVVSEYRASPANSNTAGQTETVILTIPHPTNTNHNGGMLAFGPIDRYLYIGVGDGGGGNDPPNNAQNIDSLLGKILRIDVNSGTPYSSPSDNWFCCASVPGRDEIYALGMRNPWRFSFDRDTAQQWIGDVGQSTREEVDAPILNGGNYGWRVYEGTFCTGNDPGLCTPSNYIPPLFEYATHVNGRCAVTGGYVYRGVQATVPKGTYIYGDYCSGEILSWNGSTQTVLLDTALNISSFGEDEAGELYVVHLGGTVSRIVASAPPPPPPTCTFSISPTRMTFTQGGGTGRVDVTAATGCAWTATSNVTWITVTSGASGSGNGVVTYSVAAYTGKPKNRNGSMTIAGQTFTVKQSR